MAEFVDVINLSGRQRPRHESASETPAYQGGPIDRASPCYGQDNAYVYGELLGLSHDEIRGLEKDGIL